MGSCSIAIVIPGGFQRVRKFKNVARIVQAQHPGCFVGFGWGLGASGHMEIDEAQVVWCYIHISLDPFPFQLS